MRINFRQGIIAYPISLGNQAFLVKTGSYVSLRAATSRVDVAFAHGDTDYLLTETTDINNAWGPIPASTDCWLYWDINRQTGVRTFGFTTVEPDFSPLIIPGVPDQHWFDTTENKQKVYSNGMYREVIRVFAGKVNNTTFFPLGVGFPSKPYAGSQVGVYTPNTAVGRIIVDNTGTPIRRDSGEFFTTESEFFVDGSPINTVRLEATVVTGQALEMMAKYQVVKFSDFGKLNLAEYDDIQTTMIAMLMEDLSWDEVGNVCVQGKITNPAWNWTTVGAPLWVSTGGQLTETDPHVANSFAFPEGRSPVGRVISPDTIIFDQGLGGKGDRGEPGRVLSTGDLANQVTYGVARTSVAPADIFDPVVVGDNDPRVTNSVLRTGSTMTGLLVLSGNPVLGLGAATKQYADGKVSKAGDTMTGDLRTTGLLATGVSTRAASGGIGYVQVIQDDSAAVDALGPKSGRIIFNNADDSPTSMIGWALTSSPALRYGSPAHHFNGPISVGTFVGPGICVGAFTPTLTFNSNGTITAAGSAGTAGQVLTSTGPTTPVSWTAPGDNTRVSKAGDTMVGTLNLPANGLNVTGQLQIAAGTMSVSVPATYTKRQVVTPFVLTDAGTVTIDAAESNNFQIVLNVAGATRLLANPTNLASGQVINIRISQDGVGGRAVTFGNKWKWQSGASPTFVTTANAVNFVSAYYDGTLDILIASAVTGVA